MARNRHYSPAIDRFLVSALYHEAQERGIPMTRLLDEIVKTALSGSIGWKRAENQHPIRETTHRDRL